MIKVFSVFTVLVFLSSAVKSLAVEVDMSKYRSVWTFSNIDGYTEYTNTQNISCAITRPLNSQNKLSVVNFPANSALGTIFDIKVKKYPQEYSEVLYEIPPGSIVLAEEELIDGYIKVLPTSNSNSSQEPGYVRGHLISPMYNHEINASFFGESGEENIRIRMSSTNEFRNCLIPQTGQISTFLFFESLDQEEAFLVSEDNYTLFQNSRAEYSPAPQEVLKINLDDSASDIDKADAELFNSGPDVPNIVWSPRQPTAPSLEQEIEAIEEIADIRISISTPKTVICTVDRSDLDVLNDEQDLLEALPSVSNGTTALLSQDYEPLELEGQEFVKVVFRDNDRVSGWVPRSSVKPKSECDSLNNPGAQVVEFCTARSGVTRVRDSSLNEVIKTIPDGTKAIVLSVNSEPKTINNVDYTFSELRIEGEEERLWAPNKFLTTGECSVRREELIEEQMEGQFFPLYQKPERSYIQRSNYSNAQGYGGISSKRPGRIHAACDLWTRHITRNKGGAYRSIGPGTVLRVAKFVEDTYQVVVRDHRTNRIFRYSEVYSRRGDASSGPFMEVGDIFYPGEKMGHVKWVGYSTVKPMLHFEMYQPGAPATGLTDRGSSKGIKYNGVTRRFQRHSKILNPEPFLRDLEQITELSPNQSGENW